MERRIATSCLIVLVGYALFSILSYVEPAMEATAEEVPLTSVEVAPEPEPEPTPEPEPEPVAELTPCQMVEQEVAKYDWDVATMMAIAKAESNCRLDAMGDTSLTYQNNGRTYGFSVGPFQIRIMEGREDCDTFDLATNVMCAYRIYSGQGLNAWTVYKNGRYLSYL